MVNIIFWITTIHILYYMIFSYIVKLKRQENVLIKYIEIDE